jgi:hypothetical protein
MMMTTNKNGKSQNQQKLAKYTPIIADMSRSEKQQTEKKAQQNQHINKGSHNYNHVV